MKTLVKFLDEVKVTNYKYKCHCGNEFISDRAPDSRRRPKHCGCEVKDRRRVSGIRVDWKPPKKKKKTVSAEETQLKHLFTAYERVCKDMQIVWGWEDFNSFKNFAMSTGFKLNLKLKRKDVNKGYLAHNCYWRAHNDQG